MHFPWKRFFGWNIVHVNQLSCGRYGHNLPRISRFYFIKPIGFFSFYSSQWGFNHPVVRAIRFSRRFKRKKTAPSCGHSNSDWTETPKFPYTLRRWFFTSIKRNEYNAQEYWDYVYSWHEFLLFERDWKLSG